MIYIALLQHLQHKTTLSQSKSAQVFGGSNVWWGNFFSEISPEISTKEEAENALITPRSNDENQWFLSLNAEQSSMAKFTHIDIKSWLVQIDFLFPEDTLFGFNSPHTKKWAMNKLWRKTISLILEILVL